MKQTCQTIDYKKRCNALGNHFHCQKSIFTSQKALDKIWDLQRFRNDVVCQMMEN